MKTKNATLSYYDSNGILCHLQFKPRGIDFELAQDHASLMYEDGVISEIIYADMLDIVFFEYAISEEYKRIIQDEANVWMCLRLEFEDDYDLTIWVPDCKSNVSTTEFGDLELYWIRGGKKS